MNDLNSRSIYHPVDYRDEIIYQADPRINLQERPRPASAREAADVDMFDSGIHHNFSSPRINQSYDEQIPDSFDIGTNRTMDRRHDPYGTLRTNFGTMSERMPKQTTRQNYAMNTLNPNIGINSLLTSSHRRAHSFDANLEKHGLSDYNDLLAAAGIGGNPLLCGPTSTHLFDYTRLNVPTLSSLGGIEYGTLPQNSVYPSLQPNAGLLPLPYSPDAVLLQRECLRLQHELGLLREKLNACATSIRTFWSPELKRERAMRKEENAKYAILADHLHQLQLEKQTMLETLQNMEADLRKERDLRIRGRFSTESGSEGVSELDAAKKQADEFMLENRQLKKSLEVAERRTGNLKASLTATEESLRRLIEAVKVGKQQTGAAGGTTQATDTVTTSATGDTGSTAHIRLDRIEADRSEIHRLRNQLNEACTRGSEAERQLLERNFEISKLKEDFEMLLQDHRQLKQENEQIRQDTRQNQTLQSLVDTKESKIMTLENEIRLLEDELARLRDDGLITPNTSTSSGIDDLDKTLQTFRSNERLLKSKIELLNGEISKRDCEIYALQSRLEMTDKQHQDQTHHINVLKEQIKTKDHKISMLTADVEDFRKRLKEKETQLEKKTKTLTATQTSKRQLENELSDVKEQSDMKERKLSLLQRKIENLEDLLNDKDAQIVASKVRISRMQTDKLGLESPHLGLEETIKDRDKSPDRIRDLQGYLGPEIPEDIETAKRQVHDLRVRLEHALRELDDRGSQLNELREELGEMRSGRLKQDAELGRIQAQLQQRSTEIATLQMEKQMLHKQISTEHELKLAQKMGELEGQIGHYMETNSKLQSEVDRLLRCLDNEKFDKEKQLRELQEEVRELQNNLNNMKRSQQTERKKQTQLLEETRQREENAQSDIDILKSILSEKDSRIRELEQALRESVRLTTEREIYASGRDEETRQMEQQVRDMRTNLEQIQRERNNLSAQLSSVQDELSDRENQLKTLEQECFQNYLPELEKLRRSNHDANLRVAALVKLTQGREHALTDQDRVALSGIPMFPHITSFGGWPATGSGGSRLYPPAYRSAGSTSPHLAGSAFQLIGNTANWPSGRASVPGQSMASPDVVMLTKILQEKECQLQQHLQELTHLRFRNSEQEIRMKAMQRELDTKTTKLGILEATQLSSGGGIFDSGSRSPPIMGSDLHQLRKSNQELTIKCTRLQMELDERERHARQSERPYHGTEFSEMAVLRRELITVKAEKETELMNLNSRLEELNKQIQELNTELRDTRSVLAEKENQLRVQESQKDKERMDLQSLQKKYETVLQQIGEKTDRIQQLESDCQKTHIEELKRQKSELEDFKHHVTYLQNTIQERENRIEVVEKESFRLRDEITILRQNLNAAEADAKTLREEVTYREERLRQLQSQHTEEVARLRSSSQEQLSRIAHLELRIDEKDHELKTQTTEVRRQADEIGRLQTLVEDTSNRLSISQKRVEERELRLRKVESENHDLLDEIHGLRKGHSELESQVDSLRQRLLDRQDRPATNTPLPIKTSSLTTYSASSSIPRDETDFVRKQYAELSNRHEQVKKQLDELQIQYDQIMVQRNKLSSQLEELTAKYTDLEEKLQNSAEKPKISFEQTRKVSGTTPDLRMELERKEAQIFSLSKELERIQSGSVILDKFSDNANQQLLISDLQFRLRQAIEERDQTKEDLSLALSHVETSYMDAHQQVLQEKQALQEQIVTLTQAAQNAASEAERYQRESKQASARAQQLSRQLQETQSNCDSIARQRDSLREQLDHYKRTGIRGSSFAGSSVANLFGMGSSVTHGLARPASAGPGSYELSTMHTAMGGSSTHLARELDRLHRECENLQGQLQTSQDAEVACQKELEQLRLTLKETAGQLDDEKRKCATLQSQNESAQKELVKLQRETFEKTQAQQKELSENLKWVQQQQNEKMQQIETLNNQLSNARQYCGELEQRLTDVSGRLKAAESQTQKHQNESQRYSQLESECSRLRSNLQGREAEVQHLNVKLDQVNRDLENQTRAMEQMAIELSTLQSQAVQARQEVKDVREQHAQRAISQTDRESDRETIGILQEEIREATALKETLEHKLNQAHTELQQTKEELKTKMEMLDMLENSQIKQQREEIANLKKELASARAQIEDLGGQSEAAVKGSPLKREIDSLKRELVKREDALVRMERECQEKHTRRIEAMQAQLRRGEDEAANLSKVLDEQRAGIEERDNLIRQLRSNQNLAANVELEKLRSEHQQCRERLEQQAKRINTLLNQVESQSDELLAIKLESLTASLCEKEANIALMEFTAPKNSATDKALDKLRTERDQLQMQQRQLANTKAMLDEEKKSRQ